ncbi:hypothetical protein ACWIGI_26775 [Nocardia sp. NPDC055321]
MTDILDVLHARWAEIAGEALLSGREKPDLTLTTREVLDLIDHIAELHRRCDEFDLEYREIEHQYTVQRGVNADAVKSFERIRAALEQRTAHPEARVRQACTIARAAAERLTAAGADADDALG